MTAQDYRDRGYRISQHVSDKEIELKENQVVKCYIEPATDGNVDLEDEDVKNAIMAFNYILILQNSIIGTRSGAKIKTTLQSTTASEQTIIDQTASDAHHYLQVLCDKFMVKKPKIVDIAHIYFKTQYFNI